MKDATIVMELKVLIEIDKVVVPHYDIGWYKVRVVVLSRGWD